jgi:Ni,Fe-hydrogenase III small subunit
MAQEEAVAREALSALAMIVPRELLEQVAGCTGRPAQLVNQVARLMMQRSTQSALLAEAKARQAAEYEREGEL